MDRVEADLEDLALEVRKGFTANNRLLTGILVALIVALVALAANLAFIQ